MFTTRLLKPDHMPNLRWQLPADERFALAYRHIPLVLGEVMRAGLQQLMVFSHVHQQLLPVAWLSFDGVISPYINNQGIWQGGYKPAFIRAYPFTVQCGQALGQVAVIEDPSCIASNARDYFFDSSGQLNPLLDDRLGFLNTLAISQQQTVAVCLLIKKLGLLKPLSLSQLALDMPPESLQIDDVWVIDPECLAQLSATDLHQLHQMGGLALIYSHLSSMQHLPSFTQYFLTHKNKAKQELDLDKFFGDEDESLRF
jgi:hypothetical protein